MQINDFLPREDKISEVRTYHLSTNLKIHLIFICSSKSTPRRRRKVAPNKKRGLTTRGKWKNQVGRRCTMQKQGRHPNPR